MGLGLDWNRRRIPGDRHVAGGLWAGFLLKDSQKAKRLDQGFAAELLPAHLTDALFPAPQPSPTPQKPAALCPAL